MIRMQSAAVLAALTLLVFSPWQEARGADLTEMLIEVLEVSGWQRQIEQLPVIVGTSMKQVKPNEQVTAEQQKVIIEYITRAFDPAIIYRAIVAIFLKQDVTEEKMSGLIKMLKLPLMQKFTEWEVESSTPEAQEDLQAFVAKMEKDPPSERRIVLMNQLNQAALATEFMTEIWATTLRGIISASEAGLPENLRSDSEKLETVVSDYRKNMGSRFRNLIIVSFLHTYRHATDEELEAYIEVVNSELGQWFTRTVGGSFLAALEEAAKVAVKEIGSQLKI